MALRLGATRALDGRDGNVADRVRDILRAGVEYAFDTTGIPSAIVTDLSALRFRGQLGLVAQGPDGASIPTIAMSGKTVRQLVQGDSVPRVLIPRLLDLRRKGLFPIEELITTYPFADLDRAIMDTRSGAAVKAVLSMPTA